MQSIESIPLYLVVMSGPLYDEENHMQPELADRSDRMPMLTYFSATNLPAVFSTEELANEWAANLQEEFPSEDYYVMVGGIHVSN